MFLFERVTVSYANDAKVRPFLRRPMSDFFFCSTTLLFADNPNHPSYSNMRVVQSRLEKSRT